MYVIYIKIYIYLQSIVDLFKTGVPDSNPAIQLRRLKERDELISLTVLSRVSFLVFVLYMKSSDTKML